MNKRPRTFKKAGPLFDKGGSLFTEVLDSIGTAETAYQIADKAAKDAVRLRDASSKYNEVFKSRTDVVDEWMKDLRDNYAMSTREAKSHLSATQAIFASTGISDRHADGLSHRMVKHAADLGSYYNRSTEHFADAIQSAILGDYMAFKKHGIDINSEMVQQQALDMNPGRTADTLTQAEKAYASFLLILEKTAAAVGDMEKNSDNYNNTTKRFNAELEDLSATSGRGVIDGIKEFKEDLAGTMDTAMAAFETPSQKEVLQKWKSKVEEMLALQERIFALAPPGSMPKPSKKVMDMMNLVHSAENANFDPDIDYGNRDDALEREARLENFKAEKEAELKIVKAAEEENFAQKKKSREDELKALQETNREKYRLEIELAKRVQEDTWLIRDRGMEVPQDHIEDSQIVSTHAEDIVKTTETMSETIQNATSAWAGHFSQQLYALVMDSDRTWRSILGGYLDMLGQMVLQKQVVEPILKFTNKAIDKGFSFFEKLISDKSKLPSMNFDFFNNTDFDPFGTPDFNFFSTPEFNPFDSMFFDSLDMISFADGGILNERVVGVGTSSGRPYEFGEAGREVFIPEKKLSRTTKPAETHYHITNIIKANDSKSFADQVKKNAAVIHTMVGQAMTGNSELRRIMMGTT
ncbi:MAG: hypothetical protein MI862_02100 [Desulfobacterales bacterium]|nr:hypothetical protein [Desulfobacterales bacterium]